MAKRKRSTRGRAEQRARNGKRVKVDGVTCSTTATTALLHQYYAHVLTLRQYLASRLPKRRRTKLQQNRGVCNGDARLAHLLDTTLVGSSSAVQVDDGSFVEEDLTVYTQQLTNSHNASIVPTPGGFKQTEIVDFVVWLLFRRHYANTRPKHLLCQNFQKYLTATSHDQEPQIVPGIPGIYSSGPNEHVEALRQAPWNVLPSVLGNKAERILTDLFVECGIYEPVASSSNLSQISGIPMCELDIVPTSTRAAPSNAGPNEISTASGHNVPAANKRGLSDIRFTRYRMLYARAELNVRGDVRYGLGQIHVLNRLRNLHHREETFHIMKYVFPKQFGLHNVLDSPIDFKATAQPFKDYTLREREISRQKLRTRQRCSTRTEAEAKPESLPRRLRCKTEELMQKLRKRHAGCSYLALLDHYCPRRTKNSNDEESSIRQAASVAQVSAFCRAAVSKVFPKLLWGNNITILHGNIDRFVRMRRYESLSLHDVLQGMKIEKIAWLKPPKVHEGSSLSQTDFEKRRELLAELLYYLFDSFLMPLIRGHFHVTESNVHRNQVFYFRHDIWKEMSEPALVSLKQNMLEECDPATIKTVLSKRSLGVSHVRLLPKAHGMRPIINLRRRVQKLQGGRFVLGKSINSLLTPAFSVLNHERSANPQLLGSALFSIDDIFPRLQIYRQTLAQKGLFGKCLYFAKVDVQACFDTIPQKRLLLLAERILRAERYHVARYSRAKLTGGHNDMAPGFGAKPSWKFLTKATSNDKWFDFATEIETDTLEGRSKTVYIDGVAQRHESRKAVLDLLEEHVGMNLIKIGKRLYRQKGGIPQGSILSSLLCSYFYAELEQHCLTFMRDGRSTLLRLIDDFLLISTERDVAEKFMQVMHAGIPEFGVAVKGEKSQANFDVEINGQLLVRVPEGEVFPFCGNAIDTVTLDITKDEIRRRKNNIGDSMTVEYSKLPGQSFYRKTLNALKLQMHAMLLSTAYNSIETVLSNLHCAFIDVAQKSYHYVKSLPLKQQPSNKLIIRALDDSIKLACVLTKQRKRSGKDVIPYECCISNTQTRWLACSAYTTVFSRRQTKFGQLLKFLHSQMAGIRRMSGVERRLLEKAASTHPNSYVPRKTDAV